MLNKSLKILFRIFAQLIQRVITPLFIILILPPIAHAKKPFPYGLYESGGPIRFANDDAISRTVNLVGQEGVLVRVAWDLCSDNMDCLLDTIELNLDTAESMGLKVALGISDGNGAPPFVKATCELFAFVFRDQASTLCLPWDTEYLAAKTAFTHSLGQRFDAHPALAYVYFVGSCSTNGFEGHCRIDENDFANAGYTVTGLSDAYITIMQGYIDSFPQTPIVFEAHTLFNQTTVWDNLWQTFKQSNKLGIATWWCSERLSVNGHDTDPMWDLVQEIARTTFSVCQTVGEFTNQPWRFSDFNLSPSLDYGIETDWNSIDVNNAVNETMNWMSGSATHVNQSANIAAYNVAEIWTQDMNNNNFSSQLAVLLDSQNETIFLDGFEVP